MTDQQFKALAQLMRLRGGAAQEAARLALVDGLRASDASRQSGLDLRLAHRAIKNARDALSLVYVAAGVTPPSESLDA